MRFLGFLPDFVVPVGASDSNVIGAELFLGDATRIGLTIPTAGAGKLRVSNDNVTWFDHTDLTAGAVSLDPIPFKWMKITLTAAASGTDVHIGLSKQWEA